jgi:hypothetical protein
VVIARYVAVVEDGLRAIETFVFVAEVERLVTEVAENEGASFPASSCVALTSFEALGSL